MTQKVLSFDLGGTKLAAGVVDSEGRILQETQVRTRIDQGKAGVILQLTHLGKQLLALYPEIQRIGVASAGPLDMIRGILLDPTNFKDPSGTWGEFPLVSILQKKLKRSVRLENDAAAAALAEHWLGVTQKCQNFIVLTLGTGLGTGIFCNGTLVRSGQLLHPEAGHIIIKSGDRSAPCGCGNYGCAEAYLSGTNFAARTRRLLNERRGKSNSHRNATAEEIAELGRRGDSVALDAFDEYSGLMATTIYNYSRIYCPEMVVLTGSFAKASDLFQKNTENHLKKLLKRTRQFIPKLLISSLHNRAGLLGGAYVAFMNEQTHGDGNVHCNQLGSH